MYQRRPAQAIIVAYSDQDEAARRPAELEEGRRAEIVGIIDAAVCPGVRAANKGVNAKRRGRRGLLSGGVAGVPTGVMVGLVGRASAGGVVFGGLSGRLRTPFTTELLGIGEELPPGSSVLIAAGGNVAFTLPQLN